MRCRRGPPTQLSITRCTAHHMVQVSFLDTWGISRVSNPSLNISDQIPQTAVVILRSHKSVLSQTHSLGFGLCVCDLTDENCIGGVWNIPLFLHVWWSDCQQRTVHTERQRRDAGGVPVELTQTLLIERIPDVHKAIRTPWTHTHTQSCLSGYPSQRQNLFILPISMSLVRQHNINWHTNPFK